MAILTSFSIIFIISLYLYYFCNKKCCQYHLQGDLGAKIANIVQLFYCLSFLSECPLFRKITVR